MAIFIDEAGFTGPDLLNKDQPFFILSSLSIEEAEAAVIVANIKKSYKIQAQELKAKKLLKTAYGKKAIIDIINQLQGRFAISCNHKEYSLCCKFFEYVFEPVLQDNNMLFYEKKFHLFIANILYIHVVAKEARAVELLLKFNEMMRQKDIEALKSIILSQQDAYVFKHIIDFVEGYIDQIAAEMNIIGSLDKWVLDLTTSALFSLLRHWSLSIPALEVYCDPSKPVEAVRHFLDVMVGRTDRPMISFPGGKEYCPVFNLKQPLSFLDSSSSAGIQLADILAGVTMHALKHDDEELLELLTSSIIEESIFPTIENADISQKETAINTTVLIELAERAQNKKDPLENMRDYYTFAEAQYDISPP